MFNNFNDINASNDILPKQFLNYIDYELSCFEKITNKKFFFNLLKNDKFELNIYESKEDNNKSKYQIIYRANNLYQFVKRLLMIREYLIKYFDNKLTKTIIV
jgi:MarR-like DNA-binding transcriptional regulator SgrR of sgrS sRNA